MAKIIFAGSIGGHFNELINVEQNMHLGEHIIVSDATNHTASNINYYFKTTNRRSIFKYIAYFFSNCYLATKIIRREKPRVLITTGSGSMIPLILVARLFKVKVLYIETFASVTKMSVTGKLLYKMRFKIYVQHEELQKNYPRTLFKGSVY